MTDRRENQCYLGMNEMIRKDIIPASYTYIKRLSETAEAIKALSPNIKCTTEIEMLEHLSGLTDTLYKGINKMDRLLKNVPVKKNSMQQACYYRDKVIPLMSELRDAADEIEGFVGEKYWPYPTYGELLFSV